MDCKLEKEMNSATNTASCSPGNRPSCQYLLRGTAPKQAFRLRPPGWERQQASIEWHSMGPNPRPHVALTLIKEETL